MVLSSRKSDFRCQELSSSHTTGWKSKHFNVAAGSPTISVFVSAVFFFFPIRHSLFISLIAITIFDVVLTTPVLRWLISGSYHALRWGLILAGRTCTCFKYFPGGLSRRKIIRQLVEHELPLWTRLPLIRLGGYVHDLLLRLLRDPHQIEDTSASLSVVQNFCNWLTSFTPEMHNLQSYYAAVCDAWASSLPFLNSLPAIWDTTPTERMGEEYGTLSQNAAQRWYPESRTRKVWWTLPYEPTPEGMVKVKWYPGIDHMWKVACLSAVFPLDPSGNLDLAQVQKKWGLYNCVPVDCVHMEPFHPRDPEVLSFLAVKILTDNQSCLRVVEDVPPHLKSVRECRALALEQIYPCWCKLRDNIRHDFWRSHARVISHYVHFALLSYALRSLYIHPDVLGRVRYVVQHYSFYDLFFSFRQPPEKSLVFNLYALSQHFRFLVRTYVMPLAQFVFDWYLVIWTVFFVGFLLFTCISS